VEPLILLGRNGRRHLVKPGEGLAKVAGVGVVDTSRLKDRVGGTVEIGDLTFAVLRPSIADLVATVKRKAQVILPKDSSRIAFECDLRAGASVVEGGVGSGALTLVLARSVSPGGRVVTYEVREDFAHLAQENLDRAGLADAVEVRRADIRDGIAERETDAVVLYIPDPWKAVAHAVAAVRTGGYLAAFVPNIEQGRETVLELRRRAFGEVRMLEILERTMEVGPGTRPAFDMLGHTGYLVFASRVPITP
jgi:tRNA (adenine57-N1/adenine58-N1)-methyltransferase